MTIEEAIAHLTCGRIDCLNDKDKDEELRRMCISALEAAEKYKWHDLRKDPNDLPNCGEDVEVVYSSRLEDLCYHEITHFNAGRWAGSESYDMNYWKLVAWRYIEPFTEDKE